MRGWLRLASTVLVVGWLAHASAAQAALIGFYSFDGNANDSSGNGSHGTVHGSVSWTSNGPFGGMALTLAGSSRSDYVTVPIDSSIGTTPTETFGGWFLVPTGNPGTIQGLISVDNCCFDRSIALDTRVGGFQYSTYTGSGIVGGGQVVLDEWVFVAVSYDNTAGSYILQVGTNQFTGTTSFDANAVFPTHIGLNPTFDAPFRGSISSVFFYDEALSAGELAAIQQNGPSAILTPEPSSLSLLGSGLTLFAAIRRRRRAASLG